MKCADRLASIADLALGKASAEAEAHCAVCDHCAQILEDLRRMASAFRLGTFEAPKEVVQRAIAIRSTKPRLQLIRSTRLLAGARKSGVENFQRVYEGGGVRVRILYSREPEGWHVMVRSDPPAKTLVVSGKTIDQEFDAFEFSVSELAKTGCDLIFEGFTEAIPAGDEPLEDDLV